MKKNDSKIPVKPDRSSGFRSINEGAELAAQPSFKMPPIPGQTEKKKK